MSEPTEEVSMVVAPGDVTVIRGITIAGISVKFRKPLRVLVELIHDCQLNLAKIERKGKT